MQKFFPLEQISRYHIQPICCRGQSPAVQQTRAVSFYQGMWPMDAFVTFLKQDWYFAFPMLGMSMVGITLVVWRLLLNFGARTNMSAFLPAFQEKLHKEGPESALKFCQTQPGLIPRRLFTAGLETSKQGLAAMRRAMAGVIELEIVPELNYLLPTILAIAKIATMVGLLGTVISMIGTFTEIGKAQADRKSTRLNSS